MFCVYHRREKNRSKITDDRTINHLLADASHIEEQHVYSKWSHVESFDFKIKHKFESFQFKSNINRHHSLDHNYRLHHHSCIISLSRTVADLTFKIWF